MAKSDPPIAAQIRIIPRLRAADPVDSLGGDKLISIPDDLNALPVNFLMSSAVRKVLYSSAVLAALAVLVTGIARSLPALAQEIGAEARERVILMKTGRVMTGFATRNAGGWLVEQSNGRIQVPEDQVNVVADSLVDAYRKQRDSVVEPTPATHMNLAQWCISYRLHHQAREELRKCLRLDPEHASARKLLKRLDDMLEPSNAPRVAEVPGRTIQGFLAPDVESLGGLSPESAAAFTQKIQPLLTNKCGNGSCHGTTASRVESDGFRLHPVRLGAASHRMHTERNLAEVLRYVDLQEPALSPLLTIPRGSHAGTSGVFNGSTGHGQLKTLREWTKAVAREKQIQEEELSGRPALIAKSRRPPIASPATAAIPPEVDDSGYPADFSQPQTVDSTLDGSSAKSLPGLIAPAQSEIRTADKPHDPFDPDIFNRRFHNPSR